MKSQIHLCLSNGVSFDDDPYESKVDTTLEERENDFVKVLEDRTSLLLRIKSKGKAVFINKAHVVYFRILEVD